MLRSKHFAVPAYFVAFLLLFFPLLDTTLSVLPARAGEVAWRFGATGLFSRALMTPFLGLLIAFAVAVLLEHRSMQLLVAVLSGLAILVLGGASGLFVLDALEMRAQVRPEAKLAFDVAAAMALGKYSLAIVGSGLFTVAAWKVSASDARARKRGKRTNQDLVMATALHEEVAS